jgi:hypothetical protein
MAKKLLSAFDLAHDLPKKQSKKSVKYKKRIEIPGDFDVATAIDNFVNIKKQISDLELKLNNIEEVICDFGVKMFIKGCISGECDNPVLQGHKEKVQFLTVDKYKKPTLDTEKKLTALGINSSDYIEDSTQYILNASLLKDPKIKKKVGKALADIHPNMLYKKTDHKIKDGTVKNIKDIANGDLNKMIALINIFGVINYPLRMK